MRPDEFVNLHVHTEYSLLDGVCRIKKLVERVKELRQNAVAITDHGNMYGAAEFWKEAKNSGIKPIIGCEVYVAPRTRFDREPKLDSSPYHLILLCENNKGYSNLVKIVSYSNLEGFYGKPRVDIELLKKYHEGLICLSACLAGEIPRLLLNSQYEGAKEKALEYRKIFGEGNYYIEVQNHNISDEIRILPQLYRLSAETGIPLAATNDCHYINKSDSEIQDIMMCIQTGKTVDDKERMKFETDEFYVKSAEQMAELFAGHEEAVSNTSEIARRCNVELEFDSSIKLPEFQIEGVINNNDYFRELCRKGMTERYRENITESIKKRLEYELDIIIKMGYTDYFLIVWDFIRYARNNNIPVGPGRGSGAGSLCAYCIGITDIDPMRYGLLFERFLNPERVSMPDFDIDFCIEGRQSVKDYVTAKYGADKVSEIIAFDTLKARAAVRDVGRVLNVPYQLCDRAAKLIDPRLTLEESLRQSEELKKLCDSDRQVRRIIDLSLKIEGMPRHTSVHAAGVVISAVPLNELVPLQKSDNTIITQYTMKYLEALGLLKMDFLGLRNLTVIRDAVREIRKTDSEFDINKIPDNDKNVFEMLSEGDTAGVFQFESEGITQLLIDMSPERLEDLTVALSLYRPGPMKSIPVYISNRKNPDNIKYIHPILEDILSDTYGVIIYQEQVMEICRKLAGYSYAHADIVRRAMSKKKHDEMLRERESFVSGAEKNGVPEKTANIIFDEMVSFASYAFNKSHAAAYAYLAYQTAYLKYHYRGIYMAALMSSVMSSAGKIAEYINSCRSCGIEVTPPDVNRSMKNFSYTGRKMYFGLLAVKNAGAGLAERIISERQKNGEYKSLQDFCERTGGRELNKKALESLIKAGAFDGLGLNRRQMIENYEMLMDMAGSGNRGMIEGQLNLFGAEEEQEMNIKIPFVPEYESKKLLAMEKEATGMYLSGSPLAGYKYLSGLLRTVRISAILNNQTIRDGEKVKILCIVQGKKLHTTKKGDKMCFLSLGDETGEIEAVVFPDLFAVYSGSLSEDSIIIINGTLSVKDESVSVVCGSVIPENDFGRMTENMKLCIKTDSGDSRIKILPEICGKYRGNTQLCFYFNDLRKTVRPRNNLTIKISPESYSEITKIYPPESTGLIN